MGLVQGPLILGQTTFITVLQNKSCGFFFIPLIGLLGILWNVIKNVAKIEEQKDKDMEMIIK